MSAFEVAKRVLEKATGLRRPGRQVVSHLVRAREPETFRFADDGETPNNPKWPLVIYRSPVDFGSGLDPAAIFEDLFALNEWDGSWRNGIYDFLHFHTKRHEVLGVARGNALVAFGGSKGVQLNLKTGDVAILPAGTGHRRIEAGNDLLVIGAYPHNSGAYDQPKPSEEDHRGALRHILEAGPPEADPVYGADGPLIALWR